MHDAKVYPHYSDYRGEWPWPNFSPREVACRHCGELYLDQDSMDALQDLREAWGKPIIITSGHRCAAHNNSVGGAMHSRHMLIAFDCVCPAEDQARFVRMALDAGFTGIGRYPGKGFVHLDTGPTRAWWG